MSMPNMIAVSLSGRVVGTGTMTSSSRVGVSSVSQRMNLLFVVGVIVVVVAAVGRIDVVRGDRALSVTTASSTRVPAATTPLLLGLETSPSSRLLLSTRGGAAAAATKKVAVVARKTPPPPRVPTKALPRAKAKVSPAKSATSGGHHDKELMSATTAVANVLADLCPHGMLPIAFGMAAAGSTGPVLSVLVLLVFGALSWFSLVSFARAAQVVIVEAGEEAGAGESLSAVWARTLPNGYATAYIPDLGCVCLTVGCLLFYSAFIGDLFGSLLSGIPGLPPVLQKRWSILLLLHAMPILPLCLKRDLSALQYSSMTGLVGIVYTIFFVAKRLVDGSYAPGGHFHAMMPPKFQPAPFANFAHKGSKMFGYLADVPPFHAGKGLLVLMNMSCVAYACHYNAVKYYMELKKRAVPDLMGVMAKGIGGTAFVFISMMLLGFATFGSQSQALLLNNYHGSKDVMATFARLFTGVAIISGYALMFSGLKAALFSLLKLDKPGLPNAQTTQNRISMGLLALIAIAACFVTEHELGTVIGIVGSVFGSVVIYMFPAFVNNSLLDMRDKKGKLVAKPFFKGEKIFNNCLAVFGVVFAVLGTWISLASPE